jgi:four helix bundle protein
MTSDELKARTKSFAHRVLDLCDALPLTNSGRIVSNQLGRAGTSVGANYRASCKARSTAEFVSKVGVVEEEADECQFWIELVIERKAIPAKRVMPLLNEARELTAIMAASRKTAAKRLRKPKNRSDAAAGIS